MYGIDIEYIIMGLAGAIAFLLLLCIILFAKLSKLNKKYNAFMAGRDGKSLEEQVENNFKLMSKIDIKQQQQDLDIMSLSDQIDNSISKINLVKYNAFKDMGGKLSFVLTLLNDKRDGVIINCMHSTSSSYVYAKKVEHGKSDIELSAEEAKSLADAMR